MSGELSSIENRPDELRRIPNYESIPNIQVTMDIEGSIGKFLNYDLFDLDGIQPIESEHLAVNNGVVGVDPSEESIRIYQKKNTKFQLVSIVVNAFGFVEKGGVIHAKPYSISLKVGTKHNVIEEKGIDLIKKFNLEEYDATPKCYVGFNPFTNAYPAHH
jgi:hypothetical protein